MPPIIYIYLLLLTTLFTADVHAADVSISQQLRQCEKHFKADRLTTGKGGTALVCYQTVLKKDPTNAKALAGLGKIEARYQVLINKAQKRGIAYKVKRYQARLRTVAAVKTKLQPPPSQPRLKILPPTTRPIFQIDPNGHLAKIKDVAFTPDGRYLVSAGYDKLIRVWDLKTGRTARTLRGQIGAGVDGKIYAMALSPDGRWLATGGYPSQWGIRLYDFASGKLVALLKGHTNVVLSLAFSPNSRFLVSGSSDTNAILWDVQQQRQLHTLHGHTDAIYAVAFTPDSKRMVTGSDDHSLRLWQVHNGEQIATLKGHTDDVVAVAVGPDLQGFGNLEGLKHGDGLIASGSWDNTIRLWHGRTGRFIKTLANQGAKVGSLSFSPDGRYLVSSCGGGGCATHPTSVWSIPDGEEMASYEGHDNVVGTTAISPDGRLVATGGGNNQEIHLWTLRDANLIQRLSGVGASVWTVGFSTDGRTLAWGNTSAQLSPTNRGPVEYRITLPTSDGFLLSAPQKISSRGAGSNPPLLKGGTASFSPNACITLKQKGEFCRAQDKWRDWTLRTRSGKWGSDSILEIRDQNRTVASIERGATDGYRHKSYTFTADGQRIISGGSNGWLTAYNRDGDKLGDYIGHTGDVWAVAVSPDDRLLISGSFDQTVRVWDVQSRENLLTLFHGTNGEWVAWTPSGHYTASANGDKMVGWQINRGVDNAADYISAAQLGKQLNRPDIVADTVRLHSVKQALDKAGLTGFSLKQLIGEFSTTD